MIHFTCDMCGRSLLADEDTRYVVKIEVYAAYDPMEVTGEDLEADRGEAYQELLDELADLDGEEAEGQVYKVFRFDLCPACQAKYLKDPLLRTARSRVRFTEN